MKPYFMIICFILTIDDGKIFTYGIGEYGSLGHGGAAFVEIPRPLMKF